MPWPRPLIPFLLAAALWAHAPVAPPLRGPLRVEGARILDAAGAPVLLRGAALPSLDAATPATLGVLRVRWNGNSVRIPISPSAWQREGRPYQDRVAAAVALANQADLAVILAVSEPSAPPTFWTECATRFRNTPNLLFALPRPASPTTDWDQWRAQLQQALDPIRAAGATHIVAAPALSFEGFPLTALPPAANVLFESLTPVSPAAIRSFGPLLGRAAVYAGAWGLSSCNGLPASPREVNDVVFTNLFDFDDRSISWTASQFAPGSLLTDIDDYTPSAITPAWQCGQPGIGETVLTWITGDPTGFGHLRRDAIASAAGGPATPLTPGQLVSLYIEQMGPAPDQFGTLDATRRLPLKLGGTEVLIDGAPAPILFAGQYQINIQVPPSLVPGRDAVVQVKFQGIPSNRIAVPVVAAAPELFHDVFTKNAIALNENGTRNSATVPAAPGSIVVLFGTGTGAVTPPAAAGAPAPSPHPILVQPLEVRVGGEAAEVLFAGEVPGFIGLTQINARLPRAPLSGAQPVVLRIGPRQSQSPAILSLP